jgi:hypothetical protein
VAGSTTPKFKQTTEVVIEVSTDVKDTVLGVEESVLI